MDAVVIVVTAILVLALARGFFSSGIDRIDDTAGDLFPEDKPGRNE